MAEEGGMNYPNIDEFCITRQKKLLQAKGRCQECRSVVSRLEAHHIDGTRDNHASENIIILCVKCHRSKHGGPRYSTKYTRLYGYTIKELSAKFGVSTNTIYELHAHGELSEFIKKAA